MPRLAAEWDLAVGRRRGVLSIRLLRPPWMGAASADMTYALAERLWDVIEDHLEHDHGPDPVQRIELEAAPQAAHDLSQDEDDSRNAELADRLFLLGRRLQDRGLKLVVTGLERDPPAESRCKAELRTEPEPAPRRPLRCCRSLGLG